MEIGTSEAEPIWTECLRKLTRRGLRGVKLVVSDAQDGSKERRHQGSVGDMAALPRPLHQKRAGPRRQERSRRVVSAFIATAFV